MKVNFVWTTSGPSGPLSLQSCTISGSGVVGVCIGGEADADVPSLPATINTAAIIVNPWNGCPQLAAKVVVAACHVAVFVTPPVPRQLQIVAPHLLIFASFTALVQKRLDRRREVHEVPQDFLTGSGVGEASDGADLDKLEATVAVLTALCREAVGEGR